eukprot:CAMPEP_0180243176 /NCGR_PEP_ID=MMETSP0987-20121128/33680_1 /TAXON_ID=697907 /ORGANISM="non described non described, Strain CCMP2293" /LENGTH=41 /DNA_ID= /DNA_START= /DNA_END= /DNA_ORIENTATION=
MTPSTEPAGALLRSSRGVDQQRHARRHGFAPWSTARRMHGA